MKDTLQTGLTYEFKFKVPGNKTVPYLYPESSEMQVMPKVLATGFMMGLIEWTCIKAINPHIDWPREQSVGIEFNIKHLAPTPPGLTISVKVKLEKIDGRILNFKVEADDGIDKISEGTHIRAIIDAAKFDGKVKSKLRDAEKS
jgi:fluoroacetyl-CoA thioesterase